LAWTIEFLPEVEKDLRKIGAAEARRIIATVETRIAKLEDPRQLGSALRGSLSGLWRWRIGDYRVVARIEDDQVTILMVSGGAQAGG
jgi:mRNA interferase RelE/StbE